MTKLNEGGIGHQVRVKDTRKSIWVMARLLERKVFFPELPGIPAKPMFTETPPQSPVKEPCRVEDSGFSLQNLILICINYAIF